jgi:hypothetical protein
VGGLGWLTKGHSPSQYRYRLKEWGIKKRTTTEEKQAVISALGKRSRTGATTDDVVINEGGLEKMVDKKQLKRFINDQIRHAEEIKVIPGV